MMIIFLVLLAFGAGSVLATAEPLWQVKTKKEVMEEQSKVVTNTRLDRVNEFVKAATQSPMHRGIAIKAIHCDKHHGRTDILEDDGIYCHLGVVESLLEAFEVEPKDVYISAFEGRICFGLPEGTLKKKGL